MVSSIDFHLQIILGLLPSYLCTYMQKNQLQYVLRWQKNIVMVVPRARTELGKTAVQYAAPSAWNTLQNDLNLSEVGTLGEFQTVLKECDINELGQCNCS